MKNYARRGWEPEADAWLQEHAPQMRFAKLVERYREAAQQNGWRPRTASAMRMRLSKLRLSSNRQVVNLDTGEVYPDANNAAKAVGRQSIWLRRAIKEGRFCAGYRWAYVDKPEAKG